jgi:hypothetical protein
MVNKKHNINVDIDEELKIIIRRDNNNNVINDKNNDNKNNIISFTLEEEKLMDELIKDKKIMYDAIYKINIYNDKYLDWFKIISSIKHLYNDYELFKEFNGSNYDIKENKLIWDNMKINNDINTKVKSINYIFNYYREINKYEYGKIIKKHIIIEIINDRLTIKKQQKNIDNYYKIDKSLIDNCIELKKEDLINDKYLNENIIIDAYNNGNQNIFIKSGLGTGKSVSVCNFLKYYLNNVDKDASILILSPRILYSQSIKQTLENGINQNNDGKKYIFDLYNDEDINIHNSNLLIMSIYSIVKLKKKYDLIVMDEIESLLSIFNTAQCHIDFLENFNILKTLINNSKINLMLDGDINNTSLLLFKTIENKKSILYMNNNNFKKRNVIIYKNKGFMDNKLDVDIKNNKKIVIFNFSKNDIEKTKKDIEIKYPNKTLICHYSKSKDNERLENRDMNGNLISINEIWNKCDILLYNISITVGIDFNIEYFDKIYVYYDTINNVRDVIQSLNRVRNYKDNEINIYNKYTSNNDDYNMNSEYVLNEFKKDIKKNEDFIKEYNEYIDKNNEYNLNIKSNKNDDLDAGKDINYLNVIDKYLNMDEYLEEKYEKMDLDLKNVFNRSLLEIKLSKKYSLSTIYYFFNKVNYNIQFNYERLSYKKEIVKKSFYDEIEDEYIKYFKKYYNLDDEIDIFKLDDKYNKDNQLFIYINDNQKYNKKKFNDIIYDNIKHYIKFNNDFEYVENADVDIDSVFNKYISSVSIKYFDRLKNFKKGRSHYNIINNKLKKNRCLELINADTLKYEIIMKDIFKYLNIDKDKNINNYFEITNSNIQPLYKYIKDNINDIIKIDTMKVIYNKNKNNYVYKILKEFLSYYNIDVSYKNSHGCRYDTDEIIFNYRNYLNYIIVKNNDKYINNCNNLFI